MKKKFIALSLAATVLGHSVFANVDASKKYFRDQVAKVISAKPNQKKKSDTLYMGDKEKTHEEIITMTVSDILDTYGASEGMNIIYSHLMTEINNLRQEQNIAPLQINHVLEKTAQGYADHICGQDYAHKIPKEKWHIHNIDKSTPDQRCPKNGYTSTRVGEVITYTPKNPTIQQAMTNRKNSPSHRAALCNPLYKQLGIGYKENYWVINLGNPDEDITSQLAQ